MMINHIWHNIKSLARDLWSGRLVADLYRRYFEQAHRPRFHGLYRHGAEQIMNHAEDNRTYMDGLTAYRVDPHAIEFPDLPEVGRPSFPDVSAHLDAGEDSITDMPNGAAFRRGYGHLTREELEALLERMKKAERYEECQEIQNILDLREES